MTSIEWLIDQIKEYDFTPPSNNEEYVIVMPKWIFDAKRDEAKEMHKQEIIDAWNGGDYAHFYSKETGRDFADGSEYYQETFVSKGSDEVKEESLVEKIIPHQLKYNLDVMEKLARISSQQETLYTEEQVREAIELADRYNYLLDSQKKEIIQSLKQPKKD